MIPKNRGRGGGRGRPLRPPLNPPLCTGRTKDNNLLLKIEIDSEFLILTSRLNQSFRVQEKNKYLKQSVLQVSRCLFLVLKICFNLFPSASYHYERKAKNPYIFKIALGMRVVLFAF